MSEYEVSAISFDLCRSHATVHNNIWVLPDYCKCILNILRTKPFDIIFSSVFIPGYRIRLVDIDGIWSLISNNRNKKVILASIPVPRFTRVIRLMRSLSEEKICKNRMCQYEEKIRSGENSWYKLYKYFCTIVV